MATINKECLYSFEHYIKDKSLDDLLVGIDSEFIELVKVVNRSILSKFNFSEEDNLNVAQALVISCLTFYHLFRIQKESNDLSRDN